MSNIFITSDEHYGHQNIIEYCGRPFKSLREMEDEMVWRHNEKVPDNPNVVTIHLGDMFWGEPSKDGYWHATDNEALAILERLNGSHAFIYGNHDELMERSSVLRSKFYWIKGANKESGTHIIRWNKHEITLCHYAMTVWNRSHKGSWMLYGHSHGELKTPGKSFDVGVDCHNFEPWSMEEIDAEMAKRPQAHVIENVWPGKETRDAGETLSLGGSNRDVAISDLLGNGGLRRA